MGPTEEQQDDFLSKVLPIATQLVDDLAFKARKGTHPVTRALNLACGNTARTKNERSFQSALLAEISRTYPGDDYPEMCAPTPACEAPKLRVVGGRD